MEKLAEEGDNFMKSESFFKKFPAYFGKPYHVQRVGAQRRRRDARGEARQRASLGSGGAERRQSEGSCTLEGIAKL